MLRHFPTTQMTKPKRKNVGSPARIMQESTLNAITHNTSYTVTLEEDGEDCVLPLPDEILDELDWNEGDILEWIVNEDNTITIRKAA